MTKISGMLLFILFVALATVDGLAATYRTSAYGVWSEWVVGYTCDGASIISCETSMPTPPSAYPYFLYCSCENGPSCNHYSSTTDCRLVGVSGSKCSARHLYNCYATFTDNKCEADSLQCITAGDTWTNTGASTCGGYSCKINHCKAADSTWLSTSIAACTGSNNYALVNTDSTCEHVGTCCNGLDSIPEGNSCKWRCDSVVTVCNGRSGALFGAVLPDTSVSGQDTTFSYQCFYNCAYSPNPDSTVYIVEGNTVLAGPSDSIADGIKSEWFSSIRSTTGSIYVYDYLSPSASEYVDSIAAMKCVEHLWRCVINNKYVYWYDNQEVPAGCTNIVRVK